MSESTSKRKSPELSGRTVLVTRPQGREEPLRSLLENAGARVLFQPTVEIVPLDSYDAIDRLQRRIGDFRRIVFASGNGVRFFLNRFLFLHGPESFSLRMKNEASWWDREIVSQRECSVLRDFFSETKCFATGPGTAAVLREYGVRDVLVPREHTAEGIVELLRRQAGIDQRILIVRASRGRDVMKKTLDTIFPKRGSVEQVVAYESRDLRTPDPGICNAMTQGVIDWTTCTSSAIAESLVNMFGSELKKTKLVSLSPITSETIRRLGHDVALESAKATMQGIFEAIRDF